MGSVVVGRADNRDSKCSIRDFGHNHRYYGCVCWRKSHIGSFVSVSRKITLHFVTKSVTICLFDGRRFMWPTLEAVRLSCRSSSTRLWGRWRWGSSSAGRNCASTSPARFTSSTWWSAGSTTAPSRRPSRGGSWTRSARRWCACSASSSVCKWRWGRSPSDTPPWTPRPTYSQRSTNPALFFHATFKITIFNCVDYLCPKDSI